MIDTYAGHGRISDGDAEDMIDAAYTAWRADRDASAALRARIAGLRCLNAYTFAGSLARDWNVTDAADGASGASGAGGAGGAAGAAGG